MFESDLVKKGASGSFGITLPCEEKDLGGFISRLLGKPQTIERVFKGVFEVRRQDIISLFRTVHQRLTQQNDSHLIQFTVKILFNDDSSVLLNSLEEFEYYSDIEGLISVGVDLSWTYLIKFQQKDVPEKQQIDLSMRTGAYDREMISYEDNMSLFRGSSHSSIFLRINHTERTWAVDIQSLLTGQIKTVLQQQNTIAKLINKYSSNIGWIAGILFISGAILGAYMTTLDFINNNHKAIAQLGANLNPTELLIKKVEIITEIVSSGAWSIFSYKIIAYLLASFIFSIFFGIYVEAKSSTRPESFILLTDESEVNRKRIKNANRFNWIMLATSTVIGIATGIISNILFSKYFVGI